MFNSKKQILIFINFIVIMLTTSGCYYMKLYDGPEMESSKLPHLIVNREEVVELQFDDKPIKFNPFHNFYAISEGEHSITCRFNWSMPLGGHLESSMTKKVCFKAEIGREYLVGSWPSENSEWELFVKDISSGETKVGYDCKKK